MNKKLDKILEKYRLHEKDQGSTAVQLIMLEIEKNSIIKHLEKKNKKDYVAKRALLKKLAKTKSLFSYLERRKNSFLPQEFKNDLKLLKEL